MMNLNETEFKTMMNGCVNKDPNMQRKFYEYFYPRLMTLSIRMSPDRETAKDLLQDSFVKIYQRLKTIKGDKNDAALVYTWCKRIVNNTIIDYLRKHKNMINPIEIDDDEEFQQLKMKELDMTTLNMMDLSPTDVMSAIESLPPVYKAVFGLIIEGYSHAEVAEQLGIVEGTSKSNYHKARKSLMKTLNEASKEEKKRINRKVLEVV